MWVQKEIQVIWGKKNSTHFILKDSKSSTHPFHHPKKKKNNSCWGKPQIVQSSRIINSFQNSISSENPKLIPTPIQLRSNSDNQALTSTRCATCSVGVARGPTCWWPRCAAARCGASFRWARAPRLCWRPPPWATPRRDGHGYSRL